MSILHVVTEANGDKNEGEGGEELDPAEVTRYRRWAAQLNYIALDNPVIAYAVKEVARKMSKPVKNDFSRIGQV